MLINFLVPSRSPGIHSPVWSEQHSVFGAQRQAHGTEFRAERTEKRRSGHDIPAWHQRQRSNFSCLKASYQYHQQIYFNNIIRAIHKSVYYRYGQRGLALSSTQACFVAAVFPSIPLCLWSWASGIFHWWECLCIPDSLGKRLRTPVLMNPTRTLTHKHDCHLQQNGL